MNRMPWSAGSLGWWVVLLLFALCLASQPLQLHAQTSSTRQFFTPEVNTTNGTISGLVENADVHYAQSGIFTPADVPFARDGVAAECTPNIETLVVRDVDIEQLRRHKLRGTVQNWNDRRKDLYHVRYTGPEDESLDA